MSRYRPLQAKSSPYITPAGYTMLDDELKALWKRRQHIVPALSTAAAEGDRSENAEYIYRKKELREIDCRIRYLQKRLPDLTVVHDTPKDQGHIYFGAWVALEDESGTEVTYRIVGADETDARQGFISIDSPMTRALFKKAVDDEARVQTPDGERRLLVRNIRYTAGQ